jgi:hypothetical protein
MIGTTTMLRSPESPYFKLLTSNFLLPQRSGGVHIGFWTTVKTELPTLIVPTRPGFPGGFGPTLNATLPLPLPVAGPLIVIHEALGVAVHAQAAPVVTEITHGVPPAGNNKFPGSV